MAENRRTYRNQDCCSDPKPCTEIFYKGQSLEKEAVNKGVSIGQTHDIEIPPPRPKRKPSNPYPRKKSVESTSQGGGKEGKQSIAGSQLHKEKHLLDLEKELLLEITECNGRLENIYEGQNRNSEVSNLLQAAQHTTHFLPNENTLNSVKSRNLCTFVEFVPSLSDSINKDETCKSILTSGDCKEHQRLELDRRPSSHDNVNSKTLEFMSEKSPQDKTADNKGDDSEKLGFSLSSEVQSTQNYPRHVPVHILDGSPGVSAANITSEISHQESIDHQTGGHCANLSKFCNPTSSASEHQSHAPKSSINQPFRNFLPIFPPIQNQDDYQAYHHVSSTISSLIGTALLQNPGAHAAASFASTFWPCATMEAPGGKSTMGEAFPSQRIRVAPSMAEIAGATVAAATAWWAANGLLSFCAPFQAAINCSATAASTTPVDTSQARAVKSDKGEAIHEAGLKNQQQDPECSEALQEQHNVLKSPSVSTSNSEEHEDPKQNAGISAHGGEEVETVTQPNDTKNLKSRKQVDRSSCGSNTPSSSEVETDALEKHENGKEVQEYDINHQSNDSSARRGRVFSNINDSWKEVSEEGRMAFQALFSRDILPQSFYSCQDLKNKGHNVSEDMQPATTDDVQLHPNDQHMVYSGGSNTQLVKDVPPLIGENNNQEVLPTLRIEHANPKTRRTGFKPYKRCSIEAKDSRVANCSGVDDEKCPKRIRVEGDATST